MALSTPLLVPMPAQIQPTLPQQQYADIWALLEAVTDPEIPVVNLREMGILRAVRQGADGLEVVITPTYSGCPAMGQMEDDVAAVLQHAGIAARVVTQLAPAWTTDWMSAQAREKLRAYGIAPPVRNACAASGGLQEGAQVVTFAPRKSPNTTLNQSSGLGLLAGLAAQDTVACPQCGSDNTTEVSHFGSTACKALYRCLQCMEPFDYFKPY